MDDLLDFALLKMLGIQLLLDLLLIDTENVADAEGGDNAEGGDAVKLE